MTAHSVLNVRAAPEWGNLEYIGAQKERSRLWDRSRRILATLARELDSYCISYGFLMYIMGSRVAL